MSVDPHAVQARLDQERERVRGLLRDLQRRPDRPDPDEGPAAGEQDTSDRALGTVERQTDEAIVEQLEAELGEIDAARQRLADGTYGLDEVTGEPIDAARLEARPTARTNVGTRADGRRGASAGSAR